MITTGAIAQQAAAAVALSPAAAGLTWSPGVAALTNPGPGNGGTAVLISIVPGPAYDGSAPAWTAPADSTQIADWEVAPAFPFVHRVRMWTSVDDGRASWTFGYNPDDTTVAQTQGIVVLDGVAPSITVAGPNTGNSATLAYPTTAGGAGWLALALATGQNDDEVTAPPNGAGVWTELWNNTDGTGPETVGATPNRRLGALHWARPNTGTIDPGNSTWDATTASHVLFTLAIPPLT